MISEGSTVVRGKPVGISGERATTKPPIAWMLDRSEVHETVRIHGINVQPLAADLIAPFPIASDRWSKGSRIENVVVTMESQNGMRGYGEAAPFFGIAGDMQEDLYNDLWKVGSRLRGAALTVFELESLLKERVRFPAARAAMEMAFFDVLARMNEQPLATFLNPDAELRPVETGITIPLVDADQSRMLAQQFVSKGFTSLKVKIGKNVIDDVDRVQVAHELFRTAQDENRTRLLVDANEGYRSMEIGVLMLTLRGRGIFPDILEQPIARYDYQGQRVARAAVNRYSCEMFVDESVFSLQDAIRVSEGKLAGGINLKLMKHGGIIEAVRIAEHAFESGLKLMIGGMIETRLGMTASLHVATALGVERFSWIDLDTPLFIKEDGFAGGLAYDGPIVTLPDSPGIGVIPV